MSFVHPLLLTGLVLAGIPVLLHLIMRQNPRHLLFPAMRFLMQRHRTNQRKLQLRHLLLLALRILLIAIICLALARPKILNERLNLSSERPVAAVLLFDTSFSMEYTSGGKSRLDEAKRRAQELLRSLPDGSRAAVLDSAEQGGEWLPSLSLAEQKIEELRLRPTNPPLTSQLITAYDLFGKMEQEAGTEPDDLPVRFLYIFSDRAEACWDARQLENLKRLRDRLTAPGPHAVFVDVGAEEPADVALDTLDLPRQVLAANERVLVRVSVRATGAACDTELACQIDNDPVEQRPVKLQAGDSRVIPFERPGLPPGFHQVKVSLATADALPFDNVRYATFEVRGARTVLIVTDDDANASIWSLALRASGSFQTEVRTTAAANRLSPLDLGRYRVVCLLDVAHPKSDLWEKLERYVRDGGGLAIIPGARADRKDYDLALRTLLPEPEGTQSLLPARLVQVVSAGSRTGAIWSEETYQHPVMAPFKDWRMTENVDFFKAGLEPAATRFWEVEAPAGVGAVVVYYAEPAKKLPALVERNFDRKKIRGRVLLFTTPLDDRRIVPGEGRWNDYLKNSFYFVLANKTVGYLAGAAEEGNYSYLSGQTVPVLLPPAPRFLAYTIQGPGLTGAEAVVSRGETQAELAISQAVLPGNYTVVGADGKRTASFSVNIPSEESRLNRVPREQIEALLGEGALLPLDARTNLRDALQKRWSQPVELLPWLMLLLLLLLAAENLLANKFYRKEPLVNPESAAQQGGEMT